jgi:hypothetical protein
MIKRALLSLKLDRGTHGSHKLYLEKLKVANKSILLSFIFFVFHIFCHTAYILGTAAFGVFYHLGLYIKFETVL